MITATVDYRQFFSKGQKVNYVRFVAEAAKFLAYNLLELISYSKFGFSRPDLGGNKTAKGTST